MRYAPVSVRRHRHTRRDRRSKSGRCRWSAGRPAPSGTQPAPGSCRCRCRCRSGVGARVVDADQAGGGEGDGGDAGDDRATTRAKTFMWMLPPEQLRWCYLPGSKDAERYPRRRRGANSGNRRTRRDVYNLVDMADWQDPAWVRFMLEDCETWAVVGLSGDPTRTAYSIAAAAPAARQADRPRSTRRRRRCWASRATPRSPTSRSRRRGRRLPPLGGGRRVRRPGGRDRRPGVWFQLGVVDEDAFSRTTEAGVPMVMDTCPAIEWRRLR